MLECVEIHMHADIACMTSVQCCNVALFGWWTKICTFPGSTITTITIFNESTAGADASVEASYNVASYAGL